MSISTTVVVLAAGLGTRMKSSRAKVLHQAGGDTILNHVLRATVFLAPSERIVVVVGHQADAVRASVLYPGIRFAEQNEQRGTGHALLCARAEMPDETGKLVILNGDGPLLTATTLGRLIEFKNAGAVVTTELEDPTGYGRIVRDETGSIAAIVEQKAATEAEKQIREVNSGLYAFDAELFWKHIGEIQPNSASGEYYLTDMVAILTKHGHRVAPLPVADHTELLGINTRVELAVADGLLRARKNRQLMLAGVTVENPASISVDVDVEVGEDSLIGAQAQLRGKTRVGERCQIGVGSILRNCVLENDVTIQPYVVAQDSTFASGAIVGPFARLRQQAIVGPGVHIGNFVELKNTSMSSGSKANHLAYLGDAAVGSGSNIGAGTITCNYDGIHKNRTEIGERSFVGSNSTLIAPLEIGSGAYVAAGSVITVNVEADALAVARQHQTTKPGWAKRRREKLMPKAE